MNILTAMSAKPKLTPQLTRPKRHPNLPDSIKIQSGNAHSPNPHDLITQHIDARINQNMKTQNHESQEPEINQDAFNQASQELADLKTQLQALQAELDAAKQEKQSATESLESAKESLKSELENKTEGYEETVAGLKTELESKAESLKALEAEKARLTESVKTLETANSNNTERLAKLEGLMTLKGNPNGANANTGLQIVGEGSDASRRFEKLLAQSHTHRILNPSTQAFEMAKHNPDADKFWANNRKEISEGIGAILRDKGYLNGGGATTQDITLPADIPSLAFQHLSSMIRLNPYADLILDQFARENVQLGIAPGMGAKNFAFPRYNQITRPTTKASRTLTTGTAINAGSQAVTQKNAAVEILELGLGVDSSNMAVGLSTFVTAFSMVDLEEIVMMNLGLDYQATKNLFLQEELFRADVTLYNDKGTATATIGNLAATDDGRMANNFLASVYAYMRNAQVPTTIDGCYYLIAHPNAVQQLLADKSEKERFISPEQLDLVGEGLARNRSQYGGRVSGYKGKYSGFHVFEQNVFGVGAAATAGVQNETIATVSTLTRTSLAMGVDSIGWASALPVQVRMDEFSDFQRQKRMIWYSHENSVSLDVKTTSGTGETMRVVKLNTLDSAI